ncbi:pentatricopeptide repeat domain-containing protein [Ceratocystis lukuohia]|uniref:Pentatricopeptide repeat domain-containing protein n=1 Tax=Ceratocystis lukuohia TaxID=2019550 RepID=A0ABR4MRQ6_9PEZI
MQSFLLRAGKAQACRCRSCLTVVKTTIRNVTTGSSTRKPTLSEVVTGCYTAAFGTFAVIDAKFKDKRQDDLEAKISDTKSAIAALQAENAALIAKHADKIEKKKPGSTKGDPRWGSDTEFLPDESSHDPAYFLWDEHGNKLFDKFKTTDYWKTIPVIKRTNYKRLTRWLEEDATSDSAFLGDFSEPDLITRENEVSSFVRSIFSALERNRDSDFQPANLRLRIEGLLAQDYPRFNNADPTEAEQTHSTLRTYLLKGINDNRETTIENICYNLLVSPVPPNGKTYNSLLLQLNQAGYHSIAEQLVLNARSHFRTYRTDYPTAVCLLNHSKEANRTGLFYKYVSMIFSSTEPEALKKWLLSASDRGRYLFEVIIKGLLGLYKFRDAADMLCNSFQLGNIINSWAIVQLFSLCIYALDRNAAMIIVRALAQAPEIIDTLIAREPEIQSIMLHQIKYLVSITRLEDIPERVRDNVLARSGIESQGFDKLVSSLEFHDLRLQIEQIERATTRLYAALSSELSPSELAEEANAAIKDFDFHWTAASPGSWFGNNIMVRSPADPKFTHYTHQDYCEGQSAMKLAIFDRLVTNTIRDSQRIVLETQTAIKEFEKIQEPEKDNTTKEPSSIKVMAPYVSARRKTDAQQLVGWECKTKSPIPDDAYIDLQLKKKIALLESLERSSQARSVWPS